MGCSAYFGFACFILPNLHTQLVVVMPEHLVYRFSAGDDPWEVGKTLELTSERLTKVLDLSGASYLRILKKSTHKMWKGTLMVLTDDKGFEQGFTLPNDETARSVDIKYGKATLKLIRDGSEYVEINGEREYVNPQYHLVMEIP